MTEAEIFEMARHHAVWNLRERGQRDFTERQLVEEASRVVAQWKEEWRQKDIAKGRLR